MRILILGGTVFLGRAIVRAALERGYDVTMFNRGVTNPGLFPEAEELRGDRDGDLSALEGRSWESVIDTSGYVPRVVRRSAEKLKGSLDHYTFVSTLSVYADFSQPGMDENAPLATLEDDAVEEVNGETYGPLKARCESVVQDVYSEDALVLRPGLIVGPHDPTDRFTYWPHRIQNRGEVLAPGRPTRPIQIIDVRDLAEWTLRMVESRRSGVYNATGPETPLPMNSLLHTCMQVSGSDARIVWVDEKFLLDHDVTPWREMPLWMPESESRYTGFFAIDIHKALQDGLTFRPVPETVRDTLEWESSRPGDYQWRAGLSPEREAELLKAWRSHG